MTTYRPVYPEEITLSLNRKFCCFSTRKKVLSIKGNAIYICKDTKKDSFEIYRSIVFSSTSSSLPSLPDILALGD